MYQAVAWGTLNPRYWPGLDEARQGEAQEEASPLPLFEGAALASPVGAAGSGAGAVEVEVMAAGEEPRSDDPPPAKTEAGEAAREFPAGGGGGGGEDAAAPAPPAWDASTPSPTPTNEAAANLAALLAAMVMAPIMVSIVLPMSPRTTRLAMNGINAMAKEKMLAVSASRIIWLEPTKLLSTPLAPSTALMLPRFTAEMSTCRTA